MSQTPGVPEDQFANGGDAGEGKALDPYAIDAMDDDRDPPERVGGSSGGGVAGRYREVSIAAIVLGLIIGLVMNASITYAGLKIGFTIGGSAIAAVLGFGILKILGKGTIVETNITQTIASSVNTSNSGIIFTFPVLFLLGFSMTWSDLDFWRIALAAVAGAVLGTAFIIPLRKQMIDIDRLRFPTGTGVATILKSPGAGPKKAVVLIIGILLSALLYAPAGLPQITFPVAGETRERLAGNLDDLIEVERISDADALRTLAIFDLIESQSAEPGILARGEIAYRLTKDKQAFEEAKTNKKAARADGDDAAAERLTAEVEQLRAEIRELEAELKAMDGIAFNDKLAEQVYKITEAPAPESGERPGWDSLRDQEFGWAGDPLWGYQDLNLRLPAYYKPNSGELIDNLDHNNDGRPDQFLTDGKFDLGRLIGLPGQIELIFALAPFALGAGFITGRPGLLVLAGGILAYFVINPVAYAMGWLPASLEAHQAPGFMFSSVNRPLGIGLLLGGAMMGVLAALPAIAAAFKSMAGPRIKSSGGRDELGLKVLIPAIFLAAGLLFVAADYVGQSPINPTCPITAPVGEIEIDTSIEPAPYQGYTIGFASEAAKTTWQTDWTDADRNAFMETLNAKPGWLAGMDPHLRAAIIAIVGVLWIWFAGIIIAQCTGMTDWSPISGLALLTVVLVLVLAGSGAVIGAVMLGAALCVALTLAADMMSDLKTGYLVGAKPIRQQSVELGLVWIGPAVSMLTVLIIVGANLKSFGVPLGPGTETSAPQAQALEAVIIGVQGGDIPYWLYAFGAGLGLLLGIGSFAGLGVLVGLSVYLPFIYIATYGIGCVLNMIFTATKGRRFVEEWGVPMAAGFIVGEGVLALIINIWVISEDPVRALFGW